MELYDQILKLVLVGERYSGKTSILKNIVSGSPPQKYEQTIGCDFRFTYLEEENTKVKLQLWDTPGDSRFHSQGYDVYTDADGVLVVYDLGAEASFSGEYGVDYWQEKISKHTGGDPSVQRMLLGNKSDLILGEHSDSGDAYEGGRRVSYQQGALKAHEHGMLFFETSAVTAENTTTALRSIVRAIIRDKKCREDTADDIGPLRDGSVGTRRSSWYTARCSVDAGSVEAADAGSATAQRRSTEYTRTSVACSSVEHGESCQVCQGGFWGWVWWCATIGGLLTCD